MKLDIFDVIKRWNKGNSDRSSNSKYKVKELDILEKMILC